MSTTTAKAIAIFFGFACISASVGATKYQLNGTVSGVQSGGPLCHVAIDDPDQGGYRNAWHYALHENVCAVAKLALVTGQTVKASAQVDGNNETSNNILAIEATNKPITWAPYFR